jgi:hypothetical protein
MSIYEGGDEVGLLLDDVKCEGREVVNITAYVAQ